MLAVGIALLMLLLSVASEFGYNLGTLLQKSVVSFADALNNLLPYLPASIGRSANAMAEDFRKINLAGENHHSKTLLYPSTADGYQPMREENLQEPRELNEIINSEESVFLDEQVHDEHVDSLNVTC